MDEKKIQDTRRQHDEEATQKRASILGLQYLDTREIEQSLPLVKNDAISIKDMHTYKMVPLMAGDESQPFRVGVTSITPQSIIRKMQQEYENDGRNIQFLLISQSGYKAFMLRYDPPKEVIYDDIEIAKKGDSETINAVSQTLNSVGSDQVFDYLVDQADKLGASDIHIENQREFIRIRMRIDGALHSVANLDKDRYRILMAALASRGNISTAATTPQSGHMNKEVFRNGSTHLLNLRIEAVPTMYGQDVVMRLFNFDTAMLNLDFLNIAPKERAQIDEIVSHPRGMMMMVGPTGSGKSTTLYSILNALNSDDKKIITLEDPVENTIPMVCVQCYASIQM